MRTLQIERRLIFNLRDFAVSTGDAEPVSFRHIDRRHADEVPAGSEGLPLGRGKKYTASVLCLQHAYRGIAFRADRTLLEERNAVFADRHPEYAGDLFRTSASEEHYFLYIAAFDIHSGQGAEILE